jgi:glutamyl-tRNA reductase
MALPKQIYLLGVSYRTSSMEVREKLSLNAKDAGQLMREMAFNRPGFEALILSTCNRTEFYLAAPHGEDVVTPWMLALKAFRPQAPILNVECVHYRKQGLDAVRHLFKVASGLESMVLGDAQVLAQLKQAFEISREAGALGHFLNRTVCHALKCGKRARKETAISTGAAGIGSALAGLLASRLEHQVAPNIVILGAGGFARETGRQLQKRLPCKLTFLNRSLERAHEAARHCAGHAQPWESLKNCLLPADGVVAATSAPHAVLSVKFLNEIMALRGGAPLLVLDAGMPRNVEPGSAAEVLDIDSIRERREGALARREAAVPEVQRLIALELGAWERWNLRLNLDAKIKTLCVEAQQRAQQTEAILTRHYHYAPSLARRLVEGALGRRLHSQISYLKRNLVSGKACSANPALAH